MSTTSTPAPTVYDQIAAQLAQLVAYVEQTYAIALSVVQTRIDNAMGGYADPNTGLTYLEQFSLVGPTDYNNYVFPVGGFLLETTIPNYAAIVLATMANWNHLPVPMPKQPVSTMPIAPPAPTSPVGPPFSDNSGRYYVAVGNTTPVGATYTAPDGTVYLKQGVVTPFGVSAWWVVEQAA